MKLQIITMPRFGNGVKGKRTEPSRPFDMTAESGDRWRKTDLAKTFQQARERMGR